MDSLFGRRPIVAAIAMSAPLLLAAVAAAEAQEPVPTGERVRVTSDVGAIVGELAAVDDGELEVRTETGPVVIPHDDVSRVEVSRGRRGHPWTGMAVGAGTGLLWGLLVTAGDDIEDPDYGGEAALSGAVAASGALIGALGGLVVGSLIRTERWVEATPPGATFSISSAAGGSASVEVSVPF